MPRKKTDDPKCRSNKEICYVVLREQALRLISQRSHLLCPVRKRTINGLEGNQSIHRIHSILCRRGGLEDFGHAKNNQV
ncbi:hypothetical protein TNCV_3311351 [Trichonephila clavipes]|nr:hypothetical protein TNCV_3311351 [Trichonephila clavipes]